MTNIVSFDGVINFKVEIMNNSYIRDDFIILYETPEEKKEHIDEIILLSYSKLQLGNENNLNTITLKVRKAPRKFDAYKYVDIDSVCVFLWNNKVGARMMKPVWKKQRETYVLDINENIDMVRKLSEISIDDVCFDSVYASLFIAQDKLTDYIERLNKINIHYLFMGDEGYISENEEFKSDWSRSILALHFKDEIFKIGEKDIQKFIVRTHREVKEASDMVKSMFTDRRWNNQMLKDFVEILDKYDTWVEMHYVEKNQLYSKAMYIDGKEIVKNEFDI